MKIWNLKYHILAWLEFLWKMILKEIQIELLEHSKYIYVYFLQLVFNIIVKPLPINLIF